MGDFQGNEELIGDHGLAQSREDVMWLITVCLAFGNASVQSNLSIIAPAFFATANNLWSLVDDNSLNPHEQRQKAITVMAMLATTLEGVDGPMNADEAKRWLHSINKAKAQLKRLLVSVDLVALGKNLEKTVAVLEVIVQCSTGSSSSASRGRDENALEMFLRERLPILRELPPRILFALGKRALSEPWENRLAAAKLFRLCLKNQMVSGTGPSNGGGGGGGEVQGGMPPIRKNLWVYVELLKCATDPRDVQKLATEFKGYLSPREDNLDPDDDVDPIDKFIASAYNYGVNLLQVFIDGQVEIGFYCHSFSW